VSRIGEYCTNFERKCVLILARNEGKHALDLNINKLGERTELGDGFDAEAKVVRK